MTINITNKPYIERLAYNADKGHTAKRTESIDELLMTTIYGIQFSWPSAQKSHILYLFYRKLDAETSYCH